MSRNTLILEQINLGELDSNRYSDDNLFQKLGEIQKSNEEILSQYPAEKVKALVEEKIAKKSGLKSSEEKIPVNPVFRKHLNIQKIAGIAAIACLAVMLPFMLTQKPANTGAISLEQSISQNAKERAKGVSSIFVYKKTDDSVLRLKNKAKVAEGDIIQITYVASGAKYGSIISIDGNGYLTQHYPEFGVKASILEANGEIPLEYSYQLDDAPNFERFLFIASENQFDIATLIDAVDNIKNPLDCKTENFSKYLPEDVKIKEVLLLK